MSRSKKIIGLVLAVVMAVSMMTVAFANYNPASLTASITIDTTANTLNPGESATITVKATTNYYVSTFSIPIFYDNAYVTVSNATAGVSGSVVATEASQGGSKFYNGTSLTSADTGVVAAVYVADFGDPLTTFNNTTVLTFTVTAGATTGVTDVIRCEADSIKTSTNSVGALYIAANSSEGNTMDSLAMNNENITLTAATQSIVIPGGGTPELVLTTLGASYGTIIDRTSTCNEDGFVYGIPVDEGASIADYVETDYGSINVVTNGQGLESTGAEIQLIDTDGSTVLETYLFVMIGDVNGDGFIDAVDASAVDAVGSYSDFSFDATDGSAEGLAADTNGDGFIDAVDASTVEAVASYTEFPSQQDLATDVAAGRGI